MQRRRSWGVVPREGAVGDRLLSLCFPKQPIERALFYIMAYT